MFWTVIHFFYPFYAQEANGSRRSSLLSSFLKSDKSDLLMVALQEEQLWAFAPIAL